jgi:hypothetical protein
MLWEYLVLEPSGVPPRWTISGAESDALPNFDDSGRFPNPVDVLNRCGELGWELAAVVDGRYYLKRGTKPVNLGQLQ